jgi:hypothetical protein
MILLFIIETQHTYRNVEIDIIRFFNGGGGGRRRDQFRLVAMMHVINIFVGGKMRNDVENGSDI